MTEQWRIDAPVPHGGQPILVTGDPIDQAQAALVLVHGRGATAADIMTLGDQLAPLQTGRVVYLAPQAAGHTWYPNSFLAPIPSNEPGLSSGLAVLAAILDRLQEAGLPPAHTLLAGFSQGACLLLEFIARNARRYGGVAGLSGGLIGPPGTLRGYQGSLAGTPVFLGCSDPDPHIPAGRVTETGDVLRSLGAEVTLRLYPNLGHTVNEDEILFVRQMLAALLSKA